MNRTMVPILTMLAVLAGCQGEKKQEGAGTASGEVLEGSASDAMLPLDTVRSQAPLAPRSEGGGEGGDKAKDKPGKGGDSKAEAEPAADQDKPAAEPAPDAEAE